MYADGEWSKSRLRGLLLWWCVCVYIHNMYCTEWCDIIVSVILFSPGAKIHKAGGKTRCIEQGGVNYTLEEDSDIPEPIASCYEHAMEALKKCRDIELVMTGLEKQSSSGTCFPVTVCRRPPSSPQTQQQHWISKSNQSDRRKRKSGSNQSPSSMSTMCQTSPSVLQLSDKIQV